MLKVMFTLLVLASASLAQSSSDGSFFVRNAKHENSALTPRQMREAERLYQNACAVVQRDFHSTGELQPRFTVVVGAPRNEVHSSGMKDDGSAEIWIKKWDPRPFAQGVVVLAFHEMLTRDVITQLSNRAVRYSNASVDVAGLE
jgi:hypothetical protein